MDQKTVVLAQEIYDTHREVLDFIYEYVERAGGEDDVDGAPVWDGKSWFFNVGDHTGYSWDDCFRYSFICAGGGKRFRRLMKRFKEKDIIYAYVNGRGYVGVGTVTKEACPFREATLSNGTKLVDLALAGTYNGSEDNDTCDWIALVEWESQVEKSQAVKEKHLVSSTACRIYEHRKEEFINKVWEELKKRSVD